MNALRQSMLKNGITTRLVTIYYRYHKLFSYVHCRVHGNKHKSRSHAISPSELQYVADFLFNYAEDHAVLLPSRIPGYKDTKLQLLPSSTTKKNVWNLYAESCHVSNVRALAYTTFIQTWNTYCPSLTIMRPMTDLCGLCQNNSKLILRMSNRSEAEKSTVFKYP